MLAPITWSVRTRNSSAISIDFPVPRIVSRRTLNRSTARFATSAVSSRISNLQRCAKAKNCSEQFVTNHGPSYMKLFFVPKGSTEKLTLTLPTFTSRRDKTSSKKMKKWLISVYMFSVCMWSYKYIFLIHKRFHYQNSLNI